MAMQPKAGPPAVVADRAQEIRDEQAERPFIRKPPSGHSPGSTEGLSTLKLTSAERGVLMREIDPETEAEIRPDGIVFMPAVVIRRRLDEAVGPGRWALRQEQEPRYIEETDECIYDGSLWIDGKYVARAIGGCNWRPGNKRMNKSDAIEGAKSACLRRCGKDLGIGSELWAPVWQRQFVADWAIPYSGMDWKGKKKVMWRKRGQPISGEGLANATGIAGEFPAGFGPDTLVPEGNYAGQPLRDLPDEVVTKMAEKAELVEWQLTAKAEILRRCREEQDAEPTDADVPTVDEVLGGEAAEVE